MINPRATRLFLLFLMALVLGGCAAYETHIRSSDFHDFALKDAFHNVELAQAESNRYAEMGHNWYGRYLSLAAVVATLCTGITASIQGTKLWADTARPKQTFLLSLSLLATCVSATSLYLNSESERFGKENRYQYLNLSAGMDDILRQFILDFETAGITDENISAHRPEFMQMVSKTFKSLDDLRLKYRTDYHLDAR